MGWLVIACVPVVVYLGWRAVRGKAAASPTVFDLNSDKKEQAAKELSRLQSHYDAKGDMTDVSLAPETASVYYDLVSDLWEWGIGQSFHMTQKLLGKSWTESEVNHESRIAGLLQLKPEQRVLDIGCGVGGPMRTIASATAAHVTGITISQHQVTRATRLNERAGLAKQTKVIHANFLKMPFDACSFDAAWAIESTCYAPTLEEVYSEAFRVLKPGGLFLANECVLTPSYSAANAEHVAKMNEVDKLCGMPPARTAKKAEEAGRTVGFELLSSQDWAAIPTTIPWWVRFEEIAWQAKISRAVTTLLHKVGLIPDGTHQIHEMLLDLSPKLVEVGKMGIFTPMHVLVFRKPI